MHMYAYVHMYVYIPGLHYVVVFAFLLGIYFPIILNWIYYFPELDALVA